MTPEQKAKILVQRFAEQHEDYPLCGIKASVDLGKRCALVFVDQLVIEMSPGGNRIYWNKVKQQIMDL